MSDPRVRARLETQPRLVPMVTSETDPTQRLRWFALACFEVARVHALGVVHGDLRLSRILVDGFGKVALDGWESATLVEDGDPSRDIYGLGCMLGELVEPGNAPELEMIATLAQTQRSIPAREIGDRVLRFLEGERDWNLRAELASVHIANAVGALEAGREDLVISEATAALRLEPTSIAASELLVTADAPMPAEVAARVAVDLDDGLKETARSAVWAYVGYILFAPAFLWFASGERGYALGILVLVAGNIALLGVHAWTKHRMPEWPFVVGNALLIALIARVASPFLIAPGIAAVTAAGLAMSPTYLRPRMVVIMVLAISLSVLAPWVAEKAGWVSATVTAGNHSLIFTAPAMHLREGAQILVVLFYVPVIIAAAAFLAYSIVKRERDLRYRSYIQLWQMRQNERAFRRGVSHGVSR